MEKLSFSDAHSHSNPIRGMGARKIAEQFAKEGGWFIAFIMLPTWDYTNEVVYDVDKYDKLIELHSKDCTEAKDAGIEVMCFAGFHPAEIDNLLERGISPKEVRNYTLAVAKVLGEKCSEGKIDGIGEVGRQHYKVQVHSALIAQEALEAFLALAEERDCPVQLHLEQVSGFTAESISRLANAIGIKKDNLLIHHSTIAVSAEAKELGMWSTVLGKKEVISAALERRGSDLLLLESDFIDDSRRAGKVIYPWEIARSLKSLLEEGGITSNDIEKISVDNVKKFFGI
ncbi:MAG: TatD family hydrolase [Desulfurococcales archaeon]|uniref:Hydrolase TatD n=1 Tax=Fervidicoccus fontis TaxID=683846 RepID=A0A7J3SKC1_9CREN